MSREIKFRFYNKNIKEYFYSDEYNSLSVFFQKHEEDLKEFGSDDIILEQYTEKKDKNGKKIYEGDIVRIDWKDSRYKPMISHVSWDKDGAFWDFGGGTASEVNWSHEVIGNIHESEKI